MHFKKFFQFEEEKMLNSLKRITNIEINLKKKLNYLYNSAEILTTIFGKIVSHLKKKNRKLSTHTQITNLICNNYTNHGIIETVTISSNL